MADEQKGRSITRQEKTAAAVGAAMVALLILIRITGPDDPEPTGQPPTSAHVNWSGMTWPTTTTTSTTSTTLVAQSAAPATVPPAPALAPEARSYEDGNAGGELASIRECESGGDYSYDDGIHQGAYNFTGETWRAAGGSTHTADQASPAEQDAVAASYIASGHRGSWPNC